MDKRLVQDTEFICQLNLSKLMLMRDGDLDWFILVPDKENVSELIDLNPNEQIELMHEVDLVSRKLRDYTLLDKINVAALGNVVSQLHIHVLARYKNDRAWPAPIWGTKSKKQFDFNRVDFWKDLFNN